MSPLLRRIAYTGVIITVASLAASAGVLLWQHLNPPPLRMTVAPAAPAALPVEAELALGERRPDFTLPDIDGNPRSVAEWDGKLLFINFWATWCPPCLEEIPAFTRLQEAHRDEGVQFLGIALDSPDKVRRFIAEQGMNYPSLHGERDAIALGRRYGNRIGALPYTVVVGRDGRVQRMHQGILSESEAREIITSSR